jgi:dihydrofolate reductase
VLDKRQKYVASNTLRDPLPWENSTLLSGDAADAVAALKRSGEAGDLGILGSGELIQALMARNLIDEFLLTINPLVLGSGRRLFTDGGPPASFELAESRATTTGVLIASYRRAEGAPNHG